MSTIAPIKNQLDTMSCRYLKGVGPRFAELLEKCGIMTVQDILFHLPYRYQDRTRITPIRQARIGEWIVLEGEIIANQVLTKSRRSGQLICELKDRSGIITLRFFHFTAEQKKALEPGNKLRCYGEVRYGPQGVNLIHPEYQIITADKPLEISKNLTPIYSSTEGITQRLWRNMTDQALQLLATGALLKDFLPQDLLLQKKLMSLTEALLYVHRPPVDANIELLLTRQHPAQLRLALEELLAHHLSLRRRRQHIQLEKAPCFKPAIEQQQLLLSQLKFKLTAAQERVIKEITADISQPHPMLRLVQGDVGSGKTIVAAMSALQAIINGYQVALMAPTELLSEQHLRNFEKWLKPLNLNIEIAWLTSQLTSKQRQQTLEKIQDGTVSLIIGTHALFQEDVQFQKLGLVIIDEQHRFGVHQRLALRAKGQSPHQLVMTATPIPRTLAMTLYADLAVSIIDELPPGRTPVKTVVISQERRQEVIDRVRQAIQEKRQAYWVCTLIEESEALQLQAAQVTAKILQENLPELKIGLVHGKLKAAEKEKTMTAFKQGEIDLLVATTVIEVGVDVPNASLMIIENAERLGLAQLHQLRGRVGRGAMASYCVLLYQQPLSPLAQERLAVMRDTNDGFVVAEKDLALRGPGDVLGTRQTGIIELRVADLQRDQHLLNTIQDIADKLLQNYPELVTQIIRRWLGQSEQYQQV